MDLSKEDRLKNDLVRSHFEKLDANLKAIQAEHSLQLQQTIDKFARQRAQATLHIDQAEADERKDLRFKFKEEEAAVISLHEASLAAVKEKYRITDQGERDTSAEFTTLVDGSSKSPRSEGQFPGAPSSEDSQNKHPGAMPHWPPNPQVLTSNGVAPQRPPKRVFGARVDDSNGELDSEDDENSPQHQTKRLFSSDNCKTPRAKSILPPSSLSSGSNRSIPYKSHEDSDEGEFRPDASEEINRNTDTEVAKPLRQLPPRSSRPPLGSMKIEKPPRLRR